MHTHPFLYIPLLFSLPHLLPSLVLKQDMYLHQPMKRDKMEDETSDFDLSFTSTTSTSSLATTVTTSSSASVSARSSLSLSLPSTSLISPLPHSKSDSSSHWSAIRAAASLSRDGNLHFHHLHLLRHIGSGHLAKVFHCRLKGSDRFDFALKVVDLETITESKFTHVLTEGRVLSSLDHPFLPTLYARFHVSHYACFLIDYCPGGDLHSLLLRHPGHRLPLHVVKFFAAEVLIALEYLHALGFVYRDLKPENVLIRSDGHVMLSDFDLCFSADVSPSLKLRRSRSRSRLSCFREPKEVKTMEFVAEPEAAFSRECVGTHEYLAPEIVSGDGHGNGIDWWAFGIFVYELLYGRTPFKGSSNESTLKNIMKTKSNDKISFLNIADHSDKTMVAARDLVRRLLVHDMKERMGTRRGAAEIKRHPFFEGIPWALIRTMNPPVVVDSKGAVVAQGARQGRRGRLGWKWNSSAKTMVWYRKGIKSLGLGRSKSR